MIEKSCMREKRDVDGNADVIGQDGESVDQQAGAPNKVGTGVIGDLFPLPVRALFEST